MSDLELFQGEYRGLIFGEGTPYVLTGQLTIFDSESIRADVDIPRGDGAVALGDFLEPQDLVLPFTVYGDTGTQAEQSLHLLRSAFKRTGGVEDWLRFRTRSGIWRVRARPVRFSAPFGYKEARSNTFRANVLMAMADPRLYGDALRTIQVPVYDPTATGGGYELENADLPLDTDAVIGAGGEVLAAQHGTDVAYPILSVKNQGAGEVEAIQFSNLTTGLTLRVETTLTAGQTLVADMDSLVRAAPGPHIHVDGATRYADWVQPRTPWGLVEGTNRIRFTLDESSSDPVDPTDIISRMTWRDTSA